MILKTSDGKSLSREELKAIGLSYGEAEPSQKIKFEAESEPSRFKKIVFKPS